MTDSFQKLREILETGNIFAERNDFSEVYYLRLLDALRDFPGSTDIASLVRHVLRLEDEKQGGNSQTLLKVPRKFPFPERTIWEQASINVLSEDDNYYLISARSWQPEW